MLLILIISNPIKLFNCASIYYLALRIMNYTLCIMNYIENYELY